MGEAWEQGYPISWPLLKSFPLGYLETTKNEVTFIYLSCEIFLLLIHAGGGVGHRVSHDC